MLALLLAACGKEAPSGGTGGATATTTTTASVTGGAGGEGTGGTGGRPQDPEITIDLQGRAYDVALPAAYDASVPAPLLLVLHGFWSSSETDSPWTEEANYSKLPPEADKRGVIVATPHGNLEPIAGRFFWNATEACCDFGNSGANDVGYIVAVVQDIQSKYNIDPKRIFVYGHSNGGFMANRLACDRASLFAGVVSLAGGTFKNQAKCAASAPIAFLQVHGDADAVIPYAGGAAFGYDTLPDAPGALETTQDWAKKNNCALKGDTSMPPFDIVANDAGPETTALRYTTCEANGATELWTIHLGPHSPDFNEAWAPMVLDFLMAHPKP